MAKLRQKATQTLKTYLDVNARAALHSSLHERFTIIMTSWRT